MHLLASNNIHWQTMTKHKAPMHPPLKEQYEIPKLSGKKIELQVEFFPPFLHLRKSKFRQIPPEKVEKITTFSEIGI